MHVCMRCRHGCSRLRLTRCACVPVSVRSACMCTLCACACTSVRVCASASAHCRLQPRHERLHVYSHGAPRTPHAVGRPPPPPPSLSRALSLSLSLSFSRSPLSLSLSLSLSRSLALSLSFALALPFPLSLFHPLLAPCISLTLLPSTPLKSYFTEWGLTAKGQPRAAKGVRCVHSAWPLSSVDHGPARTCATLHMPNTKPDQ